MTKWSYTERRLPTVPTCDTIGRTPVRPDRERAPVWVTDWRMGRWQGLEGASASITKGESSVEQTIGSREPKAVRASSSACSENVLRFSGTKLFLGLNLQISGPACEKSRWKMRKYSREYDSDRPCTLLKQVDANYRDFANHVTAIDRVPNPIARMPDRHEFSDTVKTLLYSSGTIYEEPNVLPRSPPFRHWILKSARRGVSRLYVVLIFSMMFQVVYPIAREVILAAGFPNFGIQSKFGFDQEQDDWNASPGSHEEVLRPSPAGERPLQILANPITVDASRGVPTKTWILLHAVVTGVGGFENGAAKDIIGAREHWLQALAPESSCAYDANVAGRKLNPAHLEDVHSHAPRDMTARHELVWMYRHASPFPGIFAASVDIAIGAARPTATNDDSGCPNPPLLRDPYTSPAVESPPAGAEVESSAPGYRAGSEIVAARAGETETGAPVDSSLINGEILDELGEEEGAHGGRPQTRGEGSKARLASKEATVQDAPRRHRDIFADEKISGSRRASNGRTNILSPLSRRKHAELASTQNVDFHKKSQILAADTRPLPRPDLTTPAILRGFPFRSSENRYELRGAQSIGRRTSGSALDPLLPML
ncbi:hypothetical protein DFH06DRAFT_1131904 [Mycena polygramma]|nr:hypothetical protein DFH06DRAFT_1131904 [Mycena polygramma]